MRTSAFLTFAVVFFLGFGLQAQTPALQEPLFLSYEQRFAAALSIEIASAPKSEQASRIEKAKADIASFANSPAQTVSVSDFESFLKAWIGEWPSAHRLSVELELARQRRSLRKRTYVSKDTAVQARIDRYISDQSQALKSLAGAGISASLVGLSTTNLEQGRSLFAPNLSDVVNDQFLKLDDAVKTLIESSMGEKTPLSQRKLLSAVFAGYFSKMGGESRKVLISSLLGTDLRSTAPSRFAVLLQNAGPQLQKTAQVMARQENLDPKVREFFQQLESDVKPVPRELVDQLLQEERAFFQFEFVDKKPLGVGTMAQVHHAVLRQNGIRRQVVVRFLKPGILDRVEEDHRILQEIARTLDADREYREAGGVPLTPLVEDITNTVRAEADLSLTREAQRQASISYRKTVRVTNAGPSPLIIHFVVPQIIGDPFTNSRLHVQEFLPGRKLEKVAEDAKAHYPKLNSAVLVATTRLWAEEAFFKSGFYHADLHRGNINARLGESEVRIGLMDYGMAGQLTAKMQDQLIALAAATQIREPSFIANILWDIADPRARESLNRQKFTEAVAHEISRRVDKPRKMGEWITFSLDQRLVLPYDMINLNRGGLIAENALKEIGGPESFGSLTMKAALHNSSRVYRALTRYGFTAKILARLGLVHAVKKIRGEPAAIVNSSKPATPAVLACGAALLSNP